MAIGLRSSVINVTPLIDVLLVLLIIFMVVTPTRTVGLGAQIPQPRPEPQVEGVDSSVVVSIRKDLSVHINSELSSFESLSRRIGDIFLTRAERVVFVQADPDVEYRYVARAIDLVKGAGVDKVGLVKGL